MLHATVTSNALGATFRAKRTGMPDLETAVTGLFGVLDDIHTKPHGGCDLGLWDGTPTPVLKRGVCVFTSTAESAWGQVFGISAIIDHGDGTRALYGHLQELAVEVGEAVEVGDLLGLSGRTGYYAGLPLDPHLHLAYATDENPWFNKDADGGVSRLLDPLTHLTGLVDAVAQAEAVVAEAMGEPDAWTLAAHQAQYLSDSNDRVRRMLEQRVPMFVITPEVENGQRLQDALEVTLAALA